MTLTFTRASAIAVVLLAIAAAPVALSQTPPPAGQTHQDHRGDAKGQDKPGAPPAAGMSGMGKMDHDGMMHGDDMKQMMSMMRDMMTMMSAHSGMMASHAEGRIAALKSEFKITDAQAPQWDRFADALRGTAKSMEAMQRQMMQASAPSTLSARLARREEMLTAHLAAVKSLRAALEPLYATFNDEQKKVADGIRIGPMGMM
ncbi:LTXXQ motif family protein [Rhodospirillales bacterium URHD0017]|nr:LTXXQ motif family protein [Rhodospirillales bacterium URHD0017]